MRKFTIKEKTLLHLLDCGATPQENMYGVVEPCFSQEGIASSVGAARSLVSRALEELVSQKLVLESSAKVKAKKAKVKVYSLTERGISSAEELKSQAESLKVVVKDRVSKLKELTFRELKKLLPEWSTVMLLNTVAKGGVLEVGELEKTLPRGEFIDFSAEAPKLRYFFNRKKELENLKEWLESKEPKILVLKGIPGIGKTALATKFITEYKTQKNIFWYTIQEWSSLRDVLNSIARFLSSLNKSQLADYLKLEPKPALEEITRILRAELSNTHSLLVFDNFDKACDDIVLLFKSLLTWIDKSENLNFLVIGREAKGFYTVQDLAIRKSVLELRLDGLDEKGGIELLKARGLHASLKKLYLTTAGHPLCLELIDHSGASQANITRYIREEIFSKLGEQERKALSLGCVFRKPFSEKAFFSEALVEPPTVEALVERSLLCLSGSNQYSLHDLIKNFFYKRLTPSEANFYHKLAAKYGLEAKDYLEAIFHYLQAGEQEQALELFVAQAKELLAFGYAEELRRLAREFRASELTTEQRAKLSQVESLL